MPRQIDPSMYSALQTGTIIPFFIAELAFKTSVQRVWSGVGNLTVDGQLFVGVGSFAQVGTIQEGTNVEAYGTTLTLSGIDPVLLEESLVDVQPGAQAIIWFGLMNQAGNVIGTPYQIFSGTMDQPSVSVGPDSITITLALENRMIDLSRASNRRYTSADQRIQYPTDSGFSWVEVLNDQALIWGS
ncbi:hypothetical protein [Edaphobacter modestus]|uniref:Uncharacterized protein n=1 Tax=Edaphobacter modestus TaxID=388466 RepID=A0A4Q7YQA2_9BACT|nr:hypothetical protein [Edaphobacter modestus]RZU39324.1 hypothetical protein BDD14_0693 [Edaphobacter modestus]